jgi:hypothetical protein
MIQPGPESEKRAVTQTESSSPIGWGIRHESNLTRTLPGRPGRRARGRRTESGQPGNLKQPPGPPG